MVRKYISERTEGIEEALEQVEGYLNIPGALACYSLG